YGRRVCLRIASAPCRRKPAPLDPQRDEARWAPGPEFVGGQRGEDRTVDDQTVTGSVPNSQKRPCLAPSTNLTSFGSTTAQDRTRCESGVRPGIFLPSLLAFIARSNARRAMVMPLSVETRF